MTYQSNQNSEQNLLTCKCEFTYFLKKRHRTCTLIGEFFWPVRLFFLESLSPCTVITDCTFIRDVRVDVDTVKSLPPKITNQAKIIIVFENGCNQSRFTSQRYKKKKHCVPDAAFVSTLLLAIATTGELFSYSKGNKLRLQWFSKQDIFIKVCAE